MKRHVQVSIRKTLLRNGVAQVTGVQEEVLKILMCVIVFEKRQCLLAAAQFLNVGQVVLATRAACTRTIEGACAASWVSVGIQLHCVVDFHHAQVLQESKRNGN